MSADIAGHHDDMGSCSTLAALAATCLVACASTEASPGVDGSVNDGAAPEAAVYDARIIGDELPAQPEAAPFVDAGCIDAHLPPGLGAPFPCGDSGTCWSGSDVCMEGLGPGYCEPMRCRCGAVPTCACLDACPFQSCTYGEDGGGMYQTCGCP